MGSSRLPTLQSGVTLGRLIHWRMRCCRGRLRSAVAIGWQGCLGTGTGLLLTSSLAQEAQLGHGGKPHGQAQLCHWERSHIKDRLVGLKKN